MAKTTKKSDFDLLLPSLALSALVFLLAIFVGSGAINKRTSSTISAKQVNYLSSQDDIDSLENDLILLQADDLEEEITVLNQVK